MRVVATEYVTLDGSFSNPGEWSFPFWSDAASEFKAGELRAADAALYGRTTYEAFAAVWPTMTETGEFGERMNNMPKFLVSTTLKEANWGPTTIIGSDVAAEVARLKDKPGNLLLIAGSGQLVRSLTEARVIDEYRFMLHPVILGHGPYLFPEGFGKTDLVLVNTQPLANGVIVLTYEPSPA